MSATTQIQIASLSTRRLATLLSKAGYSLLILFIVWVSLHSLAYYSEAWIRLIAAALFILAFFSLPIATFGGFLIIGLAVLHASPALTIWYVMLFALLMSIYEDQQEQALLILASPVFVVMGFGFLSPLLLGALFKARGGIVNCFGCLASLGIALAAGNTRLGAFMPTGLQQPLPNLLTQTTAPEAFVDLRWIGQLSLQEISNNTVQLTTRWAEALTLSPVGLAQVLLWPFATILVFQTIRFASREAFLFSRFPSYVSEFAPTITGILVGSVVLLVGYLWIYAIFAGFGIRDPNEFSAWRDFLLSLVLALGISLALPIYEAIASRAPEQSLMNRVDKYFSSEEP